jgi:hypothetical protein
MPGILDKRTELRGVKGGGKDSDWESGGTRLQCSPLAWPKRWMMRGRECVMPDPEAEFWREFGEEGKSLIVRE